jgi:hypothetical protein
MDYIEFYKFKCFSVVILDLNRNRLGSSLKINQIYHSFFKILIVLKIINID